MKNYMIKVTLIEGPVTDDFALRNPEVSRTIRISGSSTLTDLHRMIFRAFDRVAESTHEFQLDISDQGYRCYGVPEDCRDIHGAPVPTGDTAATTIDSLGIRKSDSFGYWFDFAAVWLHRITVLDITESIAGAEPEIVERIGESPSQLVKMDELLRS